MRKLQPTTYFDGPYINVNLLPSRQHKGLDTWLAKQDLEIVEYKGSLHNNFLDYADYEYWYENIYKAKSGTDYYDQI